MNHLLASTSGVTFMPHGHCYFWRPDILWLHVGANAVITIAYILIPIALLFVVRKNPKDLPHKDLIYLFMAFILFCALSHAADIYTTWVPVYHITGWIKAATASISIITALALIPAIPDLLKTQDLAKKYLSLKKEFQLLEGRIGQMNSVYEASLDRESRIVQLKKEINDELQRQGLPPRYRVHEG